MKKGALIIAAAALALLTTALGPARAGTTLITHGMVPLSSQPPAWTLSMARAVLAAAGDVSDCGAVAAATPLGTVFTYDPDTGAWVFHCGSVVPSGEIVLVFNWSRESDGLNAGGTRGFAEAAADALYASLRDPSLPLAFASEDLLGTAVHFIGHSRGSVVNSDCAERLAAVGIRIDHVTTLDPHPVDGSLDDPPGIGDWGDRAPVTWSNVDFADNYWRADGSGLEHTGDFDGMSIASDVDLYLGDAVEAFPDIDPVFEHVEVHAWYHGTIDLAAADDGAGSAIDAELFSGWYGDGGVPERDATGFHYSAIVGGSRPPPVAGADPAWSPFEIYNGDFEIVSSEAGSLGIGYAGWLYHGGDKAGTLTPWSSATPPPGSTYYLTLSGSAGAESLTHNRLFVDPAAAAIELTGRIAVPSPNDRFQIALDDGSSAQVVADVALPGAGSWATVSFEIPAARRGRTQTLRLGIDGGGDGVEAVVDVDELHFVPEPSGLLLVGPGVAGLALLARRRAGPR